MKPTIGIIGSGPVGQALAIGFQRYDYPVILASRQPDKRKELEEQLGKELLTDDLPTTAAKSDIIVLAVKGNAARAALERCGEEHLEKKIIIDATNPIADEEANNGVVKFYTSPNRSQMEELQRCVPGARFVKAFSCVAAAFMVDPPFAEQPSMFICGNDQSAKEKVGRIVEEFGWAVEDMGQAEAARAIEPLAMLYCIPGIRDGKWNHAFRLIRTNN